MKITLVAFCLSLLFLISCQKSNKTSRSSIEGDYIGLLRQSFYFTSNGTSSVDTLDTNLKINAVYNPAQQTILLSSSNTLFNGITLNEMNVTDTTSAYFGNDKAFRHVNNTSDWRTYELRYNQINGKDSIHLNTYLPPMGGWNSGIAYMGIK